MAFSPKNIDFAGLEQKYGIPSGMLNAMMQQESGGNPNAVSPKGAQGLFQFMPPTALQYGIDPLDPQQASDGAARMVSDLARKYNGDIPSVLAAYNWGSGNLDRNGMEAAPPETKNYISSIMGRMPQQQMASNQNSGPLGQMASAVGNMVIPQAQASEAPSDYSQMSDEQLMAEAAKQGVGRTTSANYLTMSDAELLAEAQKQGISIARAAPKENPDMNMVRNIGQGAESVLTGLAAPFDALGGPIRAGMNAMGANVQPLGDMIRANSPWPAPSGPIADINRGVASALPSISLGGGLATGFGPTTTAIGETLALSPMKQIAAGGASSLAGGVTQRAGGGQVAQGLASLGAGAATFGGLSGLQNAFERPAAGTDLMARGKSLSAEQKIPSSEDLRSLSSKSYKEATDQGGTLKADFVNKFVDDAAKVMPQTKAGKIIAGENEATKLVSRLQDLKNEPMNLDAAQEVDEQLGDMIDGFVKDGKLSKEGLKIAKIQSNFRGMIENAGPDQIEGGTQGFGALQKGRQIWSQAAKMRDVEKIAARSENMEQPTTGIKTGARTLLNNANKTRGWSPEEKAALHEASKTGAFQDVLRIMGSRLTSIAGGAVGGSIGGIPGAIASGLATHAISGLSRNIAQQMQMNKINNLQGIIARGAQ